MYRGNRNPIFWTNLWHQFYEVIDGKIGTLFSSHYPPEASEGRSTRHGSGYYGMGPPLLHPRNWGWKDMGFMVMWFPPYQPVVTGMIITLKSLISPIEISSVTGWSGKTMSETDGDKGCTVMVIPLQPLHSLSPPCCALRLTVAAVAEWH